MFRTGMLVPEAHSILSDFLIPFYYGAKRSDSGAEILDAVSILMRT